MNSFFNGFRPYYNFSWDFLFGTLFVWLIFIFIFSGLLMWLWNITITRIFNTREITFWEAFRLIIIAEILFGQFAGFNLNL